ncbi:MAG TPA: hypothetical protein DHU85_01260 [Porphyromonadaceae bacterium]|nr:hypothetical protein [Porphyromonadaceae bacterium]
MKTVISLQPTGGIRAIHFHIARRGYFVFVKFCAGISSGKENTAISFPGDFFISLYRYRRRKKGEIKSAYSRFYFSYV